MIDIAKIADLVRLFVILVLNLLLSFISDIDQINIFLK